MKKCFVIAFALAAALGVGTWKSAAIDISGGVQINAPGISAGIQINGPSDFYQPLSGYGSWVNYGSYGRCWHPTGIAADWRPYTVGSWEWTDAGWYWQSDEPWAWACYHYGSWSYDANVGWMWIPGTDWAPAWVTWRQSDDYIGWAPCGPGLSVLAPSFFVFAGVHDFGGHFTGHNLIINNSRIINNTRVIKDFGRQTVNVDGHERTIFSNKGPGVDRIQQVTGRHFDARPVTDVMRQSRTPQNMRNENRPGERNQPAQRPNEQLNHEQNHEATPPPTGREQPRQFEQPRQQPEQRTTPQQERQVKPPVQQREATPPPTGREQQHIYNQPQERGQQVTPPERTTPNERSVSPERTAPSEKAAPEQRQAPSEHAMPPTGRENGSPTVRESAPSHEAAPAPHQEARPSPGPEMKGSPSGQEHKDGKDGQ